MAVRAGLAAADSARAIRDALAGAPGLDVTVCAHWQGDWPAVEAAFAAA